MSDLRSLYRIIIHPLLAVSIPFLFIVSITTYFRIAFAPAAGVPFCFYGILLLVAIEEVSIGNALIQERASSAARIREIILLALLVFVGMALVPQQYQSELWGVKTAYYMGVTITQWSLSFVIQNNFRRRESFLGIIKRKKGEELKETLRQAGSFTREINTFILFNRGLFMLFISFELISMIFLYLMNISVSGGALLLTGISIGASIIGIASANIFLNDLFIYSDGINIHTSFQRRRIVGAVVWVVFIIIASALIASDNSILPLAFLSSGLAWFSNLLPQPQKVDPRLVPQAPVISPPRLPDADDSGRYIDLSWLFGIIEKLLVTALLVGIAYFIIAPLLRGEGVSFFKKYNPIQIAGRLLLRFIEYMREILNQILAGFKAPALQVDRNGAKRDKYGFVIPDDKPGLLKRIERNTVIRLYIKIARWGGRKGVQWKGHGPMEYTRLLSVKYPEQEPSLSTVADVFEEAVFSTHLVGNRKLNEYRTCVRQVLKSRPT